MNSLSVTVLLLIGISIFLTGLVLAITYPGPSSVWNTIYCMFIAVLGCIPLSVAFVIMDQSKSKLDTSEK